MSNRFETLIQSLVDLKIKEGERLKRVCPPSLENSGRYTHLLQQISELRGRPLYYPYIGSGVGRGPLVQLSDGSVKLDFTSGIGVYILGHSHPDLIRAGLVGALEDVVMQGHLQANAIYVRLMEKVIQIAQRNSSLSQGWICPSGSMANENALKIIRQKKGGVRHVLAFEGAFAGRTGSLLEITDNEKAKKGQPLCGDALRIPFTPKKPHLALEALEAHWQNKGTQISSFIVEFMLGDGGYHLAPRSFFLPLFQFCREKGIAVWADEIQTFCRSGEFFAFEKLNLGEYIDVCTIGKSLQLSITLWKKEYNPEPGLVAGTFASSSSSLHSALALLNFLDQGFMGPSGKVEKIHKSWVQHLKKLETKKLISNIEGWGLMIGATPLDGKASTVRSLLQNLFEKGLIAFPCGKGDTMRLRFLIPAVVEEEHLAQAAHILEQALIAQ
ncbi:MAG: aminotransferase class III-fold pyridoxal phosphate-dependent enzyme [Bdellovibrionales bacterium]|nr:aminotransferase class III-fold pyridoxal phosphate-dependent enzyme [Bdellovibrionales bacterium]